MMYKKMLAEIIEEMDSEDQMRESVYLENTNDNHFKFYRISQLDAKHLVAEWGRIDCKNPSRKVYPIDKWVELKRKKLYKGYSYRDTSVLKVKRDANKIDVDKYKKIKEKLEKLRVAIRDSSTDVSWKADVDEFVDIHDDFIDKCKLSKESIEKLNKLWSKYGGKQ